LTLVAILTTLIARVRALFECDLKKIVALSTLRQLGVIVITLTLNLPILALFHLLAHATFKALLFICRGKIIHEMGDSQDIRGMGSLILSLPLTGAFFNLANLALCGFPFLAGFYSKDILVEIALIRRWGVITLPLLGAMVGLSAAYSTRLTILRLLDPPSTSPLSYSKEEDPLIKNSYLILGMLALSRGAILS
jgi:NADH-ubiquinone oxidoreductase chain 5